MKRELFLAVAVALAACAAQPAQPQTPQLAGTHWIRVDRTEDAPHFPTLDFEAERASGHAGCNRWFASVAAERGTLRFGEIGATKMMCPPPAMATENAIFEALRVTHAARIEGGQLVLLNSGSREIARFDRVN